MRRWMLWLVVAVLAVGVAAPAFSGLAAPSGDEALVMVSLSPCAIFDTRGAVDGKMSSGETRFFGIVGAEDFSEQGGSATGCGVPGFDGVEPQAQAVLLNLVAIEAAGGGNLKAWAGDGAEATGGVVNYQALAPAMNNSNAVVLELNQTEEGKDIAVKVNGAGVHVRGVVLGYFVSGDQTFLTYDGYDPDRDGSVAAADTAAVVDGFEADWLMERYCANHRLYPESYPDGPCQTTLSTVDIGSVGEYTSLAIGRDGNPVISYYDVGSHNLKVVHCATPSCSSFDTPVTLDAFESVGRYTSLAIGRDGNPVISYYDLTNGDLKVVHCTDPACAGNDAPTAVATAGFVGQYTSLAIGRDGLPVVAYRDATNGDLQVVHCSDAACTGVDSLQTLDGGGPTGDDVGSEASLAIGVDGNPIISFDDSTNGDLKVVHCTTATCSSWDTPTILDGTGDVGDFTSLAIGVDGNPIIAYYDRSNRDLKVVHCTTAACSSWDSPQTLDSTGDVGLFTSLAIGVDGDPVISYYDGTNTALKAVRCANASCSSYDAPITLDAEPDVGRYNSVAIGVDGRPVISYYNSFNRFLEVAVIGG